jgi:hypothetical protein
MLQICKKTPKCFNCIFYNQNGVYLNGTCNRVFIREKPTIKTYFYPSAISARSYDYLCGYEAKYYIDKVKAKFCNFSHIIG